MRHRPVRATASHHAISLFQAVSFRGPSLVDTLSPASPRVAKPTLLDQVSFPHLLKSLLMVLDMILVLHQEGQRMSPSTKVIYTPTLCHCVFNVFLYLYQGRVQVPGGDQ